MLPSEMIEQLKTFDQTQGIIAQVVATNWQAWNCDITLYAPTDRIRLNVITLSHPTLNSLPSGKMLEAVMDKCDQGHDFVKLPDHPLKDGRARCPYCMANGLDRFIQHSQYGG